MTSSEHYQLEFPPELFESEAPFLIGVRHHSAALSAALPRILDQRKPQVIFLELPEEFEGWIKWIQDPGTQAPVALVSAKSSDEFSFYPFAEFSPEWATIRWAGENKVPVIPIDISVNLPGSDGSRVFDDFDLGAFWDRGVECHAEGSSPEDIRRAALRVGWALRSSSSKSERDLARETWMRKRIADYIKSNSIKKSVAVIGSFHAAALLEKPLFFEEIEVQSDAKERTVSMVRYTHDLLDERSGYPAGVLDPMWHYSVLQALQEGKPVNEMVEYFALSLCRELREEQQGGASVDAFELTRMTKELARLRNLPTPGRVEFIEAAQSVLTQASEGRGRAVARSMETVLIGEKRGKLAKGIPRCGLSKHMDEVFEKLKLPTKEEKEYRLDPLRSNLDMQRHISFYRMKICGIRYATFVESSFVAGLPSIQKKWTVKYSPSTEASIELAGLLGVSLEQATAGALSQKRRNIPKEEFSHENSFRFFVNACEAGLADLAEKWFSEWKIRWESEAGLSLLIEIDHFFGELDSGHIVGIPKIENTFLRPLDINYPEEQARLLEALHRVLVGIIGSNEIKDAIALGEIVHRHYNTDNDDKSSLLLKEILNRMIEEGSDLMQGAASALIVSLGLKHYESLPIRLASWVDNASTPEGRLQLSSRLTGLLSAAALLFETHPNFSETLDDRICALSDDDFMSRIAALRKGFDILNEHDRRRLMDSLEHRIDFLDLNEMSLPPELVALFTKADLVAGKKVEIAKDEARIEFDSTPAPRPETISNQISPKDRWRLILGQQQQRMTGRAKRAGMALGQLYGKGGRKGFGGGQEDSYPSTREWAEELEALFGESVREEVLAEAASFIPSAALEIDAENVRPSVDLLQTILPLAGSMSESQLTKLRPLISRCVEELTKMLANRMRPALFGAASVRPTRRPNNRLDIPRTIRKNIARVYVNEKGETELYPDSLIFKSAQKKSMQWDLYFLVDVSGSMEPSVIYSAIVSAILTGVPWVNLTFLAFNTEVVDLSEHTSDPLALLLEVEIGGGTNIGKAMKYAEDSIRVPRRSMVMVLSDFEEGFSRTRVVECARRLHDSGVKVLGLASLDDQGHGRYYAPLAKALVSVGMPVAALSPTQLAQWIRDQTQ